MFKLASDGEIDKLIVVAQSNSTESKEAVGQLLTVLAPLITSIIQKVTRHGRLTENLPGYHQELRQYAWVALLESIQNYDVSRGVKFTTFAWSHIYHRLQTSLNRELDYNTSIDLSINLFSSTNNSGFDDDNHQDRNVEIPIDETGYAEFDTRQIDCQVNEFLEHLPVRQQAYIRNIFWDSLSKSEIARRDNISPKMVEKVCNQAFSKGRRYFHMNPYIG